MAIWINIWWKFLRVKDETFWLNSDEFFDRFLLGNISKFYSFIHHFLVYFFVKPFNVIPFKIWLISQLNFKWILQINVIRFFVSKNIHQIRRFSQKPLHLSNWNVKFERTNLLTYCLSKQKFPQSHKNSIYD